MRPQQGGQIQLHQQKHSTDSHRFTRAAYPFGLLSLKSESFGPNKSAVAPTGTLTSDPSRDNKKSSGISVGIPP
jgi:hypothetical protein